MTVIEYQRQVLRKLGWSEKNILAEEQRQQVQATKTKKTPKTPKQEKTIDVEAANAEFWKKREVIEARERAEYQKKQGAMKDQKKNISDTELRMERLRGLGQTDEQIEQMLANEQRKLGWSEKSILAEEQRQQKQKQADEDEGKFSWTDAQDVEDARKFRMRDAKDKKQKREQEKTAGAEAAECRRLREVIEDRERAEAAENRKKLDALKEQELREIAGGKTEGQAYIDRVVQTAREQWDSVHQKTAEEKVEERRERQELEYLEERGRLRQAGWSEVKILENEQRERVIDAEDAEHWEKREAMEFTPEDAQAAAEEREQERKKQESAKSEYWLWIWVIGFALVMLVLGAYTGGSGCSSRDYACQMSH